MRRLLIALLIASLTLTFCLTSCTEEDKEKEESSEVTTEAKDTTDGSTTTDGSETTDGGTTAGEETTDGNTTEGSTTEPEDTTEHIHSYSETVVKPTCTQKGYTTYACACGFSYNDNYTNTTAHTFGEWTTVTAPSAGKTGKAVRKCSVCKTEEEKVLDALPSGGDITVVASPGTIVRGNEATVTIKGAPNTEYDITVKYSSGPSSAKGLENKVSDANGNVSWTWKVAKNTKVGTYTITVEGGGKEITINFTITE